MASVYMIFTILMLASTKSSLGGDVQPLGSLHRYILESTVIKLECIVKNQSKDIVWKKDSVNLTANGFITEPTGTLTKTSASLQDDGEYKCVSGDSSTSATFIVEVFKVNTHDIVIVSKKPAILKCDLQHLNKSEVKNFYWTKNHTLLTDVSELNNRYKANTVNYTLEIPKAKRKDAGLYNCVFEIAGLHFSINVNMNMAPWIETMEKSRNLVQGDKLHLTCHVQSHPISSVTWSKDNGTFKEAQNRIFSKDNRTLIIYDLQFSDQGKYTCVATNSVNSTSMTVLVRVKDKLAALWPFLGIVAEVVILCIIIFICEKRRSKDMEDEYDNAGQQSMPNAKEHKGKDEIRQRNVRT